MKNRIFMGQKPPEQPKQPKAPAVPKRFINMGTLGFYQVVYICRGCGILVNSNMAMQVITEPGYTINIINTVIEKLMVWRMTINTPLGLGTARFKCYECLYESDYGPCEQGVRKIDSSPEDIAKLEKQLKDNYIN